MSELPAPIPRRALDRSRSGQLTPAEKILRRRNRRWLLVIAVPAVIIGAAALIASLVASSSTPSVKPLSVPAGYQAVTDGYFGYAVPSNWSTNDLYSDDVGDLDTSGATGWAAENLSVRATPPVAGESPPKAFSTFGLGRPTPYTLGPALATKVAGTQVAYRYQLSRPGFTATAIDAWQYSSGAELWLLIQTSPAVTATILSTLKA